jgi:hypothetical protein
VLGKTQPASSALSTGSERLKVGLGGFAAELRSSIDSQVLADRERERTFALDRHRWSMRRANSLTMLASRDLTYVNTIAQVRVYISKNRRRRQC